nr:MAG TPA: hypothetical protein [Caudoviricetes sp.]
MRILRPVYFQTHHIFFEFFSNQYNISLDAYR